MSEELVWISIAFARGIPEERNICGRQVRERRGFAITGARLDDGNAMVERGTQECIDTRAHERVPRRTGRV